MGVKDQLAAAAAAANQAGNPAAQQCAKPQVSPVIAIAAPKIVLVKKAYQKSAHRIRVDLSTDCAFDGTGTLSSGQAAQIRVFDRERDGTLLALPLNLKGAELTRKRTIYVEAVSPSGTLGDTILTLSISGGSKAIVNNPQTDKLTCVELQLDLCKYKPAPGGADSAPLSDADKIGTGRNIHLQDARNYAGRCLLIVRQARPFGATGYTGNVALLARDNRVRTFPYAQEVPTSGEGPATGSPLSTANSAIPATGLKLWVEGANVSKGILDTGFTVEISDLPRREGDRVNLTVVKAELRLFKSKKTAAADPEKFSEDDKIKVGRYVHKQDGSRKRGMLVVRKAEPADFTGKLLLSCWNVTHAPDTEAKAVSPRIKLFDAATAGAEVGFGSDIDQAAGAADDLKKLWVEGKDLSTALIDTQIRLGIKEAEGACDRVSLTVFQIEKVDVTLRGTPCKREAARINAMPAGAAKDAAVAADSMRANTMPAKSINTDSQTFDATAITVVRECGVLKMAATVKPPAVKLTWDIAQADDDAVQGRHAHARGRWQRQETQSDGQQNWVVPCVCVRGFQRRQKHNDDEDG